MTWPRNKRGIVDKLASVMAINLALALLSHSNFKTFSLFCSTILTRIHYGMELETERPSYPNRRLKRRRELGTATAVLKLHNVSVHGVRQRG